MGLTPLKLWNYNVCKNEKTKKCNDKNKEIEVTKISPMINMVITTLSGSVRNIPRC
jgi:hypothetical protein